MFKIFVFISVTKQLHYVLFQFDRDGKSDFYLNLDYIYANYTKDKLYNEKARGEIETQNYTLIPNFVTIFNMDLLSFILVTNTLSTCNRQ